TRWPFSPTHAPHASPPALAPRPTQHANVFGAASTVPPTPEGRVGRRCFLPVIRSGSGTVSSGTGVTVVRRREARSITSARFSGVSSGAVVTGPPSCGARPHAQHEHRPAGRTGTSPTQ